MLRIDIKPLSVNEAWKGRRFRTDKYKAYQRDLALMLPKMDALEGDLCLSVEWGFSNSGSDIDNPLKPFIDCLQKKYGFNDSRIVRLEVDKVKVKKGAEYIAFNLYEKV